MSNVRAKSVNIRNTLTQPYRFGDIGGKLEQLNDFTGILETGNCVIGFGGKHNAVIAGKDIIHSYSRLYDSQAGGFGSASAMFDALDFVPFFNELSPDVPLLNRYSGSCIISARDASNASTVRAEWTQAAPDQGASTPESTTIQNLFGAVPDLDKLIISLVYGTGEHSSRFGIKTGNEIASEYTHGESGWYEYHGYDFFPHGGVLTMYAIAAVDISGTGTTYYVSAVSNGYFDWYAAFSSDTEYRYARAATDRWTNANIENITKFNDGT